MQRTVTPELLDSGTASPAQVARSLREVDLVNRWFGGVSTSSMLIGRVAHKRGLRQIDLLDVGGAMGYLPRAVARRLQRRGIGIRITLLDSNASHLSPEFPGLVGDACDLPLENDTVDIVSSSLFLHHLEAADVVRSIREALRVARHAVVINDLVRSRLHLAMAAPLLATFSPISRHDGFASICRAYTPAEIRALLTPVFRDVEITTHFFFRMGIIVWK